VGECSKPESGNAFLVFATMRLARVAAVFPWEHRPRETSSAVAWFVAGGILVVNIARRGKPRHGVIASMVS